MDKVYHFSAPGRTEIGGNHTDHQHGCVIAAAVDMETTAEVTLNGANIIRVDSEGYRPVEIGLGVVDRRKVGASCSLRTVRARLYDRFIVLSLQCILAEKFLFQRKDGDSSDLRSRNL